jgi:broad specificity phosphatase PhoE
MRIVILRHGNSNLPHFPWITARELGRWIEVYNSAGIRDTAPPAAAMTVAGQCKVIATSDLLRSVESGRVLGSTTQMIADGLFREAGLPYSSAAFVKMPPSVWALVFRILWAFGYKANGESVHTFKKRAQSAAMVLITLARKHDSVLLAGHGLINSYIARELLSAGWNGPRKTKVRHWGFTEYTRDA